MRTFLIIQVMLMVAISVQAQEGVVLLHGLCRTDKSMNKMAIAPERGPDSLSKTWSIHHVARELKH